MPRPKLLHFQIFQLELFFARLIKLKEGGAPDPLNRDLCSLCDPSQWHRGLITDPKSTMLLARLKIAAELKQHSVRKTASKDRLQVGRERTVETRSSIARRYSALREQR